MPLHLHHVDEAPKDDQIDTTPFRGPWTVTIVMADTECGGSEEGGWWYGTYDPTDSEAQELALQWQATRIFWDEREADAYRQELDNRCQEHNAATKRRSKFSVLSQGIFEAYCFEGYPRHMPERRPYYE